MIDPFLINTHPQVKWSCRESYQILECPTLLSSVTTSFLNSRITHLKFISVYFNLLFFIAFPCFNHEV